MSLLSLIALSLLQPAAAETEAPATPAALTADQQRDLSCVAILAIVASEQETGMTTALEYPLVADRGAEYAGLTGVRIMSETGRTQEQVREDILNAVADHQARVKDVGSPEEIISEQMGICLPLLDAVVPPRPKPTLNQCAAMLQLAYEEIYTREKLSKTAQDLKTLAFVLDSRAREDLKARGYSGNESDIILTRAREDMRARDESRKDSKAAADLDYDHCFALAAPDRKDQKFEH